MTRVYPSALGGQPDGHGDRVGRVGGLRFAERVHAEHCHRHRRHGAPDQFAGDQPQRMQSNNFARIKNRKHEFEFTSD